MLPFLPRVVISCEVLLRDFRTLNYVVFLGKFIQSNSFTNMNRLMLRSDMCSTTE